LYFNDVQKHDYQLIKSIKSIKLINQSYIIEHVCYMNITCKRRSCKNHTHNHALWLNIYYIIYYIILYHIILYYIILYHIISYYIILYYIIYIYICYITYLSLKINQFYIDTAVFAFGHLMHNFFITLSKFLFIEKNS